MIRWTSVLVGGAAFAAAHLVQTLAWQTWFHGSYDPWFLNSGRAVAFTAALLVLAGAIVSAADRRESIIRGAHAAAGALAAMIIILAVAGPGTLFPIVIAFGAAIAIASTEAGALAGWTVHRTMKT
jgi:hypothetical protein